MALPEQSQSPKTDLLEETMPAMQTYDPREIFFATLEKPHEEDEQEIVTFAPAFKLFNQCDRMSTVLTVWMRLEAA